MNVYAVKWVIQGGGPSEYDPHENDTRQLDLFGIDFVTCTTARLAQHYVQVARPAAKVHQPHLLGPAQ